MTYHNAIKFIKNAPAAIPHGSSAPERIALLFETLGNPQKGIQYIRLAGSNGKTVAARMIIWILNRAGIENGCLSMPVHEEIRENLRINGEPISMEETVSCVEKICHAVSLINGNAQDGAEPFCPSINEIMLCIAMLVFSEHKCSLCVIECDHNGEDPSRFLPPPLSAVICGKIPCEYPAEVAKIRSYICRGIKEIISVPQDQDAYKIISDTCVSANCRLTMPARKDFEIKRLALSGTDFSFKGNDYSLHICGKFQTVNALTAIETAEMLARYGYKIDTEAIKAGLSTVIAPCKFEVISIFPTIIADSTHSSVAIGAVCDSLADFKETTGTKIKLCLPDGELIPEYISALRERGYSIEKISALSEDNGEEGNTVDYALPVNLFKSVKLTVKDALADLERDSILLISGDSNFTQKIRYELLARLGF